MENRHALVVDTRLTLATGTAEREAALERFARGLLRRPPALLFGHAHSLYLFASFLRSRGLDCIRPRGIISTAMVLHSWERRLIEDYSSAVESAMLVLARDRYELALELATLPEIVRGYEEIKLRNVEEFDRRLTDLTGRLKGRA